jgi:cytochrome c5
MLNINKLFCILSLLLVGCGQTFNSNTSDSGLIPLLACSEFGTAAGDRYCAAQTIIQDKCVNCHSGYHDQWAAFTNDANWKTSGRVVAGSTAGSSLITRLKNQGGDMPADNPQISDANYRTLIDWVQLMP